MQPNFYLLWIKSLQSNISRIKAIDAPNYRMVNLLGSPDGDLNFQVNRDSKNVKNAIVAKVQLQRSSMPKQHIPSPLQVNHQSPHSSIRRETINGPNPNASVDIDGESSVWFDITNVQNKYLGTELFFSVQAMFNDRTVPKFTIKCLSSNSSTLLEMNNGMPFKPILNSPIGKHDLRVPTSSGSLVENEVNWSDVNTIRVEFFNHGTDKKTLIFSILPSMYDQILNTGIEVMLDKLSHTLSLTGVRWKHLNALHANVVRFALPYQTDDDTYTIHCRDPDIKVSGLELYYELSGGIRPFLPTTSLKTIMPFVWPGNMVSGVTNYITLMDELRFETVSDPSSRIEFVTPQWNHLRTLHHGHLSGDVSMNLILESDSTPVIIPENGSLVILTCSVIQRSSNTARHASLKSKLIKPNEALNLKLEIPEFFSVAPGDDIFFTLYVANQLKPTITHFSYQLMV
jgi:hypothetical protein